MDRKCVMIVDKNLPLGLIANTTAILGTVLGKLEGEIVGTDVYDMKEHIHQSNDFNSSFEG